MRHTALLFVTAVAIPLSSCPAQPAGRADIEVHFVPRTQFAVHVPGAAAGNIGYFSAHWSTTGRLNRAVALIATDTSQAERNHTIREEITQCLGAMRDSDTYPDSIFYQPWSLVDRFSTMDRTVIQMLYHPKVKPDMTCEQAEQALKGLFTPQQIDYFKEIAFGAEYAECDQNLHRWEQSPTVRISGELTDADIRTVKQVIGDLNGLLSRIRLKVIGWDIQPSKTPGGTTTVIATAKPKVSRSKRNQTPTPTSTGGKTG